MCTIQVHPSWKLQVDWICSGLAGGGWVLWVEGTGLCSTWFHMGQAGQNSTAHQLPLHGTLSTVAHLTDQSGPITLFSCRAHYDVVGDTHCKALTIILLSKHNFKICHTFNCSVVYCTAARNRPTRHEINNSWISPVTNWRISWPWHYPPELQEAAAHSGGHPQPPSGSPADEERRRPGRPHLGGTAGVTPEEPRWGLNLSAETASTWSPISTRKNLGDLLTTL